MSNYNKGCKFSEAYYLHDILYSLYNIGYKQGHPISIKLVSESCIHFSAKFQKNWSKKSTTFRLEFPRTGVQGSAMMLVQ